MRPDVKQRYENDPHFNKVVHMLSSMLTTETFGMVHRKPVVTPSDLRDAVDAAIELAFERLFEEVMSRG